MKNKSNYNPKVHNRKSTRIQGYDYSLPGLYLITISCQNKQCLFGHIEKGKMILNNSGKMANASWLAIPEHYPNTILHTFVIMPNHVHGIIEIAKNGQNDVQGRDFGFETVGVQNFEPLPFQTRNLSVQKNEYQKTIPRSIGCMVRGFKIGVTKWFRQHTEIHKPCQRNYYDIIIRDEASYKSISRYIMANPKKWKADQFYNEPG
ncbi:MAG: transposase [Saprospiraceae bacterium]